MNEENLSRLSNIISSKKSTFTIEEARDLAKRARQFQSERGRLPSTTSNDPWEVRIAEGMYAFSRMVAEAKQGE